MNISIIIFCYNECGTIGEVVRQAIEVAARLGNEYQVVAVDDGSSDGSDLILKEFASIEYIYHTQNQGIGEALRSGYKAANKEYVCAVPGDGQFDLNELLQLKPFEFDRFYSFYRPVTGYNLYRSALSGANKLFNKWILGIDMKDVNWIKVYRKDQLDFTAPQLHSSIVESEICGKLIRSGCKPIELPSIYHPRLTGEAKGGKLSTLVKAIKETIALYMVTKRFTTKRPK